MAEKEKYYTNSFKNTFGQVVGTPVGRIQWPNIAAPNARFKPEKYTCHILFDKTDAAAKNGLNKLILACKDMQDYVYKSKAPAFEYPPVRDADKDGLAEKYSDFKGKFYIIAKSTNRPDTLDDKKNKIEPKIFQAGNLCRLAIKPIMFDKGFSWQLAVVQLIKDDGVYFRGGVDPASVLDAIEEAEEQADTQVETVVKSGKQSAIEML